MPSGWGGVLGETTKYWYNGSKWVQCLMLSAWQSLNEDDLKILINFFGFNWTFPIPELIYRVLLLRDCFKFIFSRLRFEEILYLQLDLVYCSYLFYSFNVQAEFVRGIFSDITSILQLPVVSLVILSTLWKSFSSYHRLLHRTSSSSCSWCLCLDLHLCQAPVSWSKKWFSIAKGKKHNLKLLFSLWYCFLHLQFILWHWIVFAMRILPILHCWYPEP